MIAFPLSKNSVQHLGWLLVYSVHDKDIETHKTKQSADSRAKIRAVFQRDGMCTAREWSPREMPLWVPTLITAT